MKTPVHIIALAAVAMIAGPGFTAPRGGRQLAPVTPEACAEITAQSRSIWSMDAEIEVLQRRAESESDMNEFDQLALDRAVKRRAKAQEMLSNLMKKFDDTRSCIVKNDP